MFEAGYFVDPDENAVVFVIGTKPAVTITNDELTMVDDETLQMTAATLPPDAEITWTIDATTYATIDADTGLLTGADAGAGTVKVTATITGSDGTTASDSVNVTVTAG